MKKKVLIITYYWPPSGGAGVQRWLKFVKYLRNFGWEPIIYTPENPEFPAIDNSLFKDIPENLKIIKQPIWEPYSAYKKFLGQKKDAKINAGFLSEKEKPKFTENISIWIRGNFFIPDARKFWIKPSIKFLKKYLSKNPVDIIVSTGPPHSTHLIAIELKKQLNIPWLADFRDPWTNIDFYKDLKLTKWADNKHKKLEKKVLSNADVVTTVSWHLSDDLKKLGAKNIKVITNGFDPDDFIINKKISESNKFLITHIGAINKDRNPELFWKALEEISNENKNFKKDLKIRFIGKTDYTVLENLKKYNLIENTEKIDYLNHVKAIEHCYESVLLFLPLNNTINASGIMPGKTYEYLAIKKPIFCIGPTDGDCAKIIKETKAGCVVDFSDYSGIKNNIIKYYNLYKNKKLASNTNSIKKFSRIELTKELSKIFNTL
ncbi:MAG: glycosyltransferase family 4 protein [Bacteroidales bacterium]|nr:glycosyltransferase family 4 protein [Bacteroidales bacterium]